MTIHRTLLTVAALTLGIGIHTPQAHAQRVQHIVESILLGGDLGDAAIGVYMENLTDGDVLADINADRPLTPASNMKIVTSAAALGLLGTDFTLSTRLIANDDKLIIRGEGDPSFGDPVLLKQIGMSVENLLDSWVDAVKRYVDARKQQQTANSATPGVTPNVSGSKYDISAIYIDDRVFDRMFVHPTWNDGFLHRPEYAQICGINFHNNVIHLYARPSALGESPYVQMLPLAPPIKFENEAITSNRTALWAKREGIEEQIVLRGTIKHEQIQPIEVTVNDPPIFLGELLRKRLWNVGIRTGKVERLSPKDYRGQEQVLAIARTSLKEMIVRCNRDNQNMYAEGLMKQVGRYATRQAGSWSTGTAATRIFLNRLVDTEAAGAVLVDGSGLSPVNKLSPRLIVRVLSRMVDPPTPGGKLFFKSLPVSGSRKGALSQRFRYNRLIGQMYAIPGDMPGVATLSGYLLQEGQTITFSVLINEHPQLPYQVNRLIDRLMATVAESLARRYRRLNKGASNPLEDATN